MGKGKKKAVLSDERKLYMEPKYFDRGIIDGDLHCIVTLHPGTDQNEWMATQTLSFFNHFNLLYGAISELCTITSCPVMCAGTLQYQWQDEIKGKKSKLSAPQYVDLVMSTCQKMLQDDSLFPTKFGQTFPSNFISLIRKVFRLIFHVAAHVYHHHYNEIIQLELYRHWNSLFAHFIYFSTEFDLLDQKELTPLASLVEFIVTRDHDARTVSGPAVTTES